MCAVKLSERLTFNKNAVGMLRHTLFDAMLPILRIATAKLDEGQKAILQLTRLTAEVQIGDGFRTPWAYPRFDMFLPAEDARPGRTQAPPLQRPLNLFGVERKVASFADAAAVIGELVTLLDQMEHLNKQVQAPSHQKVTLIQHVFTRQIPVPICGSAEINDTVWPREGLTHGDRLSVLLQLKRTMEHFAAAVFSLSQNRSVAPHAITLLISPPSYHVQQWSCCLLAGSSVVTAGILTASEPSLVVQWQRSLTRCSAMMSTTHLLTHLLGELLGSVL